MRLPWKYWRGHRLPIRAGGGSASRVVFVRAQVDLAPPTGVRILHS